MCGQGFVFLFYSAQNQAQGLLDGRQSQTRPVLFTLGVEVKLIAVRKWDSPIGRYLLFVRTCQRFFTTFYMCLRMPSSPGSCVCIYVFVCVFVCWCVYLCVCVCVYIHMWKPEVDVGCLPQSLSTSFFGTGYLLILELVDLARPADRGAPRTYASCLH